MSSPIAIVHIILAIYLVSETTAGYSGSINQAGIDLIKSFEGFEPDFKGDGSVRNISTIGYGHACDVWDCSIPLNGQYYPPLTEAQADELLRSDLASPGRYEDCVKSVVTTTLNENQYAALVSFTFNMGCGNLRSSTLLRFLNEGDVYGASTGFAPFKHSGGRVERGLVRRREAERVLFCSGNVCRCETPAIAEGDNPRRCCDSKCSGFFGLWVNGEEIPTTDCSIPCLLKIRNDIEPYT